MNRAFAGIKVRQRQFGVDNVNIFRRVHFPRDVNNIIVFKAANHMADGFGFTDVGQKLVAKTFTFGRAFTRPAISTNSMVVGRMRCGLTISASLSRRGSGIGTTPVFGSMVQKGSWPLQYPLW